LVADPGTELRGVVEEVLGDVERAQQAAWVGRGAEPDNESPDVGVLDDLDDGLVEVHAFPGRHAVHGDAVGGQCAQASLESTAMTVGAAVASRSHPSPLQRSARVSTIRAWTVLSRQSAQCSHVYHGPSRCLSATSGGTRPR
jgi:hypothetical protein